MKKLFILLITFFAIFNTYSQSSIENYQNALNRLRNKQIDGEIRNLGDEAYVKGNIMNGEGEINTKYDNFKGVFSSGKKNGYGIYESKGNFVYEGEFKENEITGKGLMTFPTGETYEGGLINMRKNGQGTFKWINGNIYIGSWNDDNIKGNGVLYFKDGSKYEGSFWLGNYQGFGFITFIDGSRKGGIWNNGELTNSLPIFLKTPKLYDFSTDVNVWYKGVLQVKYKGHVGMINLEGKEIIPLIYDYFRYDSPPNLLACKENEDNIVVYDLGGKFIKNQSRANEIEENQRKKQIEESKKIEKEKVTYNKLASEVLSYALAKNDNPANNNKNVYCRCSFCENTFISINKIGNNKNNWKYRGYCVMEDKPYRLNYFYYYQLLPQIPNYLRTNEFYCSKKCLKEGNIDVFYKLRDDF